MNRFRDIADGARGGLEGLLGRLASGEHELTDIDGVALSAELEARRSAGPRRPHENPLAKLADGSTESLAARERAAALREDAIRGERERRERAEAAEREAAFRAAQRDAARSREREFEDFRRRAKSGAGASNTRGSGIGGFGFGHDANLAKHYKTLNLPYGADFSEVKSAYRKLMRKYHPDMHNQSAKKQKAATELSVQVAQAYQELEKHFKK